VQRVSARRSAARRFHFNGGEGLISFQVAIFCDFYVDVAELSHKPMPARSSASDRPITTTLKAPVGVASGINQSGSLRGRSPGGL